MVRLRVDGESPILRGAVVVATYLYLFQFIGVYREPGSVNEWLHLSRIGLTGGDHWGVYSQTYSLPTFARMIGVETAEAWRTMVIILGLIGFSLVLFAAHRLSTRVVDFAVVACVLVFTPFARGVLNGQADYDGMTLVATAFLLISNNLVVAALCGVVMGLTNPEQSAVALSCIALIWFVSDKEKLRKAALALLSTVLSTGAVRSILDDPDVAGRIDLLQNRGLAGLNDLRRLLDYLPHFFAGAWFIVALVIFASWKVRSFPGMLACSLAVIAIPSASFLITTDGGRTFATVMAPPALVALTRFLPQIPKKFVLVVLGMAIGLQFTYLMNDLDDFEPRSPTMSENLDSRPQPLD